MKHLIINILFIIATLFFAKRFSNTVCETRIIMLNKKCEERIDLRELEMLTIIRDEWSGE